MAWKTIWINMRKIWKQPAKSIKRNPWLILVYLGKGNSAFADLQYGKEDSNSLSTLTFAATKG